MAEKRDAAIHDALVQLLHASRRFATAYDAYAHAPRQWAVATREALDAAERELDAAEHQAVQAQRLQGK